jgi:enoyl-[acyl-carrier protein] reductase III
MSYQGASVLVTGGSRGIGREVALRFADEGASRVAVGYLRNDRAAEAVAGELRERVADEVAALGRLDALVHSAATGVIRPALETEDKHWDWTLNANARALLSLARAVVPAMQNGAAIVAISSLGSVRVLENYALVGTSKAALESVVRYLAVELAPQGIRVNAVSGGIVDTEALDHFPNREQMLHDARSRTPAGRMVEASDLADAVLFLCGPHSKMICGQTIVVDGGFSLPA